MSRTRPQPRRASGPAAVLCAAVLTLAGGAGAKEESGTTPVLAPSLNVDFSPKTLSRSRGRPIELAITDRSRARPLNPSSPPALTGFVFEGDRDGAIHVGGLPSCRRDQVHGASVRRLERRCGTAIVGRGSIAFEVDNPEEPPIFIGGDLILFNGGRRGHVTTLYVYAHFYTPAPSALVATAKVRRIHGGAFGTRAVVSIPKLASGRVSVASFELRVKRRFARRGRSASFLTLRCPDRSAVARGTEIFSDGTRLSQVVRRPCTGR
jgi:hypothetical protein